VIITAIDSQCWLQRVHQQVDHFDHGFVALTDSASVGCTARFPSSQTELLAIGRRRGFTSAPPIHARSIINRPRDYIDGSQPKQYPVHRSVHTVRVYFHGRLTSPPEAFIQLCWSTISVELVSLEWLVVRHTLDTISSMGQYQRQMSKSLDSSFFSSSESCVCGRMAVHVQPAAV